MTPDVAIIHKGWLSVVSAIQGDLYGGTVEYQIDDHDTSFVAHPGGRLQARGTDLHWDATLWADIVISDSGRVENLHPDLRFSPL